MQKIEIGMKLILTIHQVIVDSDRILYSNDGLIYKTTDHYRTFTKIK